MDTIAQQVEPLESTFFSRLRQCRLVAKVSLQLSEWWIVFTVHDHWVLVPQASQINTLMAKLLKSGNSTLAVAERGLPNIENFSVIFYEKKASKRFLTWLAETGKHFVKFVNNEAMKLRLNFSLKVHILTCTSLLRDISILKILVR